LEKTDTHSENELRKPYNFKNISVVGMSTNVEKPAHFVPKYLIYNGYNIIPYSEALLLTVLCCCGGTKDD
jgi:predicted CoA-binding protein